MLSKSAQTSLSVGRRQDPMNANSAENGLPLPILDMHAHIFPDRIAGKAVQSISSFYNLPMASSAGTARDLLTISRQAGISHTVVFSTATRKEQVDSINQFMIAQQQNQDALLAFGTLHPDQTAVEIGVSLDVMSDGHLRGIKLHPDFQRIEADAPFVQEVCRQAAGQWPLLIHAGDPRYDFSHPRRIAHLAALFPETLIIAAHFGGWSQWPEAIEFLADLPNVVVDTSSTLGFLEPAEIRRLIDCFGTHRIVFGSDYPMWTPAGELQRLDRISLSKQEKRAILWENGARLLNLIR